VFSNAIKIACFDSILQLAQIYTAPRLNGCSVENVEKCGVSMLLYLDFRLMKTCWWIMICGLIKFWKGAGVTFECGQPITDTCHRFRLLAKQHDYDMIRMEYG
jgi:hypothetical protein